MKVHNDINFGGRLFWVGKPSDAIRSALMDSPQVQSFIASRHNLLVKVESADEAAVNKALAQGIKGDLFKLSFKSVSSRKNWFLRLWDLTSPPAKLSREFQPEQRILDWISNKPFMQRKIFHKIDF